MDSAAGSAKSCRDPRTQAIMALRGKVLNTYGAPLDEILENEEIKGIVSALGTGIGEKFNIKNLRYDRVVMMTDADADWSHITLLLTTLFLYHFPELVKAGKLYNAVSPLYKVGNQYLYSKEELDEYVRTHGSPSHITRYKGLGELNPEELWDTTMNPATRRLVQVTTDDLQKTLDLFYIFMGDKSELRRNYIMERGI